jgi:hypothetical protein
MDGKQCLRCCAQDPPRKLYPVYGPYWLCHPCIMDLWRLI